MTVLLLVDGVIAVLVLEALVLAIRRPRRLRYVDLLPNLAAGLFLLLALHAGLRTDGLVAIAAFLAMAGIAHGIDLVVRMRR